MPPDDSALNGKKNLIQPAFGITSLNDLMETLLRKRFRKRRLAILPLRLTHSISIGVEVYALAIVQHKSTPIFLNATTNRPLVAGRNGSVMTLVRISLQSRSNDITHTEALVSTFPKTM
ncbi:unnamed protein product [Albugo candida]|uniref:Uncharacterized protein n=1 Tax=Albugo candida TaxID=65357 RepID=A0A024G9U9_9STRA|nr:unnamed protein product [Albugo candida]|eukprot:CCI43315.1 unnamed protein product [Albugo candida]